MYAIVDIAGQQFKVEKDKKIFVHRLEGEEGAKFEFDQVLLVDNGSEVSVGSPTVDGVRVAAKIVSHEKGDKVIVFKKKRRKGYQKLNGHRQYLTALLIQGILGKGETLKEEAEVEKKPKAKKAVKKEEVGEVVVAETVTEAKPKKRVAKKKTEE